MFWIFSTKRTQCKIIAIAQNSMWNCWNWTRLNVKLLPLHKTQCETVAICWFLFVGQILLAAAASSHSKKPFHSNFHQRDVLHQHHKRNHHQTKVNSYICCMSGSGWNVATPFINLPPVEKDNSINCVHGYLSTDPPLPTLLSATRIFCHIFASSMNNEI